MFTTIVQSGFVTFKKSLHALAVRIPWVIVKGITVAHYTAQF